MENLVDIGCVGGTFSRFLSKIVIRGKESRTRRILDASEERLVGASIEKV